MSGQVNFANREEIHSFIQALTDHQTGLVSEDDFTALRLQNGIYGQRQEGVYMVRVKIPGGKLNVEQLKCINELVKKHCDIDFASVTTRQDIQLHFVSLDNVPGVLTKLADVGLTTREACGNTVRNVTACHLSGNCDKELTDVRPILNDTVNHFLRHPLAQHLPRKIKMSFSGCEIDCAYAMIHDLGVVAIKKGDENGFKVLVAGGLGHKPREAFVLEPFVKEDKLLAVIESVISLHNRYSDRTKRARSRLKFLVDKFGEEKFVSEYKAIYKITKARISSSKDHESKANWQTVSFSKRQPDLASVTVNLPLGDLKVTAIDFLIESMETFSVNEITATQTQSLILNGVALDKTESLKQSLSAAGFKVDGLNESVVACPGSWTCRLGITGSRDLASRVSADNGGTKVHVSGCHNGCAQPQVSDIGLHGEGRRKFGRLIPYYRMFFGGNAHGGGELALKGPEVPSARAESAIRLVNKTYAKDRQVQENFFDWSRRKGVPYFTELLSEITHVTEFDLPELLRDVGQESEFKVLQLGGGECAGISEETVAAQLKEAEHEKSYRDIFVNQAKYDSVLECAENMLRLVGKSILFKVGVRAGEQLTEISAELTKVFDDKSLVISGFDAFLNGLESLRGTTNKEVYLAFSKESDEWIDKVTTGTDEQLKALVTEEDAIVDLTNDGCPLHYIKAKKALSGIAGGESLQLLLKSGEDTQSVSKSLESTGFVILESTEKNEAVTLLHVLKPSLGLNVNSEINKSAAN